MALVLGIETSCDETGIALYSSDKGLLANILSSQADLHDLYGGVVPELASRDHIRLIITLIDECFNQAKIAKNAIDAISYTAGPGLSGALLIGAGAACSLAFSLGKPVIAIHHLEGHLLSPLLSYKDIPMPFIALLVSGGHSQLILVRAIGDYTIIGDTIDDAAGEAFDKTAKMLDLPYPGGSFIAKLAKDGDNIYHLPRPMLNSKDLNMSFSGLKTAANILINNIKRERDLTIIDKQNIAKAVEEAITDVLVAKAKLALTQNSIKYLVVSGGVSSNISLRNKLDQLAGIKTFYPPLNLCTDNGAMIALAGCCRLKYAAYDYAFNINPRWNLSSL